jgi:hypothetical protein
VSTYLAFQTGSERILVEVDPVVPVQTTKQEDGKAALRHDELGEDDGKAGLGIGNGFRFSVINVERSLSDVFVALRANAKAFMDEVTALDVKPSEIEMSFGLKASGELGNFVVGKVTGDANYKVKMVWKK